MTTSIKRYKAISFSLFTLINVFFCIRYALRISLPIAITITVLYLMLSFTIWRAYKQNYKLSTAKIITILTLYIIVCSIILYFIPIESIRVDRVEMINIFWDNVFNGEYPYGTGGSLHGNRPAGWPVFFILCYPFYLIKIYAIIPILSIIALLLIFYRKNPQTTGFISLLIVTSPAIYWEIICRSTIFFNAVIFIFWFMSLSNISKKTTFKLYLSAIIGGLLLSTRSVLILPIVIFACYSLHSQLSFSQFLKWCSCLFLTFLLSIIPLLFYGIDNITFVNPIIIQSSFLLPFELTLTFSLLSLIPVLWCKSYQQTILYSGISLYVIFSVYIIYCLISYGIDNCLYYGCDISYFLFCIPFFFYILLDPKDNKHHDK